MGEVIGMRDELARFAVKMERQLRENDHKEGWNEMSLARLLNRLKQETGELERAIKKAQRHGEWGKVIEEAADVGNFAMMIADVCDDRIEELHAELDAGDDD